MLFVVITSAAAAAAAVVDNPNKLIAPLNSTTNPFLVPTSVRSVSLNGAAAAHLTRRAPLVTSACKRATRTGARHAMRMWIKGATSALAAAAAAAATRALVAASDGRELFISRRLPACAAAAVAAGQTALRQMRR